MLNTVHFFDNNLVMPPKEHMCFVMGGSPSVLSEFTRRTSALTE